jgi:hypothetical protein
MRFKKSIADAAVDCVVAEDHLFRRCAFLTGLFVQLSRLEKTHSNHRRPNYALPFGFKYTVVWLLFRALEPRIA